MYEIAANKMKEYIYFYLSLLFFIKLLMHNSLVYFQLDISLRGYHI